MSSVINSILADVWNDLAGIPAFVVALLLQICLQPAQEVQKEI
jgi:hypothetical protein